MNKNCYLASCPIPGGKGLIKQLREFSIQSHRRSSVLCIKQMDIDGGFYQIFLFSNVFVAFMSAGRMSRGSRKLRVQEADMSITIPFQMESYTFILTHSYFITFILINNIINTLHPSLSLRTIHPLTSSRAYSSMYRFNLSGGTTWRELRRNTETGVASLGLPGLSTTFGFDPGSRFWGVSF